jgi:hypothetical protein
MILIGKPDVQTALKELRPDTPNWYGWATHDGQGNKIPNDQRMCWEHAIVVQEGVTKPTKAEFDAKLSELVSAWENKDYARKRVVEYPSIGDQLDALFHAGVFPEEMAAKIQEVKNKFPKE